MTTTRQDLVKLKLLAEPKKVEDAERNQAKRVFDRLSEDDKRALYHGDLSTEDLDLDLSSEVKAKLFLKIAKWGEKCCL